MKTIIKNFLRHLARSCSFSCCKKGKFCKHKVSINEHSLLKSCFKYKCFQCFDIQYEMLFVNTICWWCTLVELALQFCMLHLCMQGYFLFRNLAWKNHKVFMQYGNFLQNFQATCKIGTKFSCKMLTKLTRSYSPVTSLIFNFTSSK